MTNRTDDFNRADNAATLGTPSDAGGGYIVSGTWGIGSNRGLNADSASLGHAVLESSVADVEVQVTLPVVAANSSAGLVFRHSDVNNFLVLRAAVLNEVQLCKLEAGSFSAIGSPFSYTPVNGDVLKVIANGSSVTAYVNGVLRQTETITFNQTATKHGLWAHSETTARFDDFSITGIVAGSLAVAPRRAFPFPILNH